MNLGHLDILARDHRANIARLQQLAKDGDEKADDAVYEDEKNPYWRGFRDGLLRAIGVLEGSRRGAVRMTVAEAIDIALEAIDFRLDYEYENGEKDCEPDELEALNQKLIEARKLLAEIV